MPNHSCPRATPLAIRSSDSPSVTDCHDPHSMEQVMAVLVRRPLLPLGTTYFGYAETRKQLI